MDHQSTPSWQSTSKFREHLSITVPPNDFPIARSKFSPESPPSFSHNRSTSSHSYFSRHRLAKDVEAGTTSPRSGRSALKDRLTKFFFDLRTLKQEPDMMPIQPRNPPTWAPKKTCCKCHDEKETKRRRWWILALIVLLLYLLADTIFLNSSVVLLLSDRKRPREPAGPPPITRPPALPTNAQQCISQYELNAPTNPSGYPCSTCLPILQSIPPDFAFTKAQDAQQVVNAVQFCGLNAIFVDANSDGQSNLAAGGWMNDVRFCVWRGVSCDGTGRVSSL